MPSVDQVLQRFVSALGGEKELEKIHTTILRGTIELPDYKANGSTAEYFKYPDHFAAVTDIPGHGTTKLVYDGHEGWQVALGMDSLKSPVPIWPTYSAAQISTGISNCTSFIRTCRLRARK